MRLTVLGNSQRLLLPLGSGTSYLLEAAERRVLLDCSNRTSERLKEVLGENHLDALVLSHFHLDAVADLLPVLASLRRRTPVFLPATAERRFREILDSGRSNGAARHVDVRPVTGGSEEALGDLRFRFARARHNCPCVAVRVEADGRAFAYLADTGLRPGLVDLARGADVAVVHTLLLDRDEDEEAARTNMSAGAAGRLARDANVRRLALCHVPFYLHSEESVREAALAFPGEVVLLEEEGTYEI
jgi:ribonuclease BN (tRNA processing enzyme)